MKPTEVAGRLRWRVAPRLAVRLIPKSIFQGWLGRADRLYVCLGDYEEVQGLKVGDAADRLYGGKRGRDEKYGGFGNHHWRIAWHHEPPGDADDLTFAAGAEEYFVVTVALDDEEEVDLFPGTWKSIAYIATDAGRMKPRTDIRERLLELHEGVTPFETREKAAIDFLEYSDPGRDEYADNVQGRYYAYVAHDSGYANEVLDPFGVYNRCWHGRGYVGAYGELWCRVFLGRNLPLSHGSILSCELLPRDAVLPIRVSPATELSTAMSMSPRSTPPGPSRVADCALGCLLGGAVGDALGAPVEFLSLQKIREGFGPEGIRDFAPAYGRVGAITDDTQMTLFTAEGCLRAVTRWNEKGICHPPAIIYHAYLRWLRTQGVLRPEPPYLEEAPGWLIGVNALHRRRAPGNTCLSALESGRMGSVEERINGSKGCGGVMRVAPIGLLEGADAFQLGCEAASITHGHPSGYIPAGCLALMIRELVEGRTVEEAVHAALDRAAREPGHEETTSGLRRALEQARRGGASPERVEALGAGWVAEEALAMSVYCALVADDGFERGVVLAVNHSGDSDSTGAITGNLLGTRLGSGAIPQRWIDVLELRAEIEALSLDVASLANGYRGGEQWWQRYPGC